MKGQERNTAQLERIRATMEQRWSSEGAVRKEKSGDDAEGPRMAPEKVRRRGLCYLLPVSIVVLFFVIEFFIFCDLNV